MSRLSDDKIPLTHSSSKIYDKQESRVLVQPRLFKSSLFDKVIVTYINVAPKSFMPIC